MSRSTRIRNIVAGSTATAALAGVALIAGAGTASAQSFGTQGLGPGQSYCVSQQASYQVRGDGWATGGGARFKLLRGGYVLDASPGRVGSWAAERRASYGNFPGAGIYSVCAYNTGDTRTTVTLQIRTDGELG